MRALCAALCGIALAAAATEPTPPKDLSREPGTWVFRADYSQGHAFSATAAETGVLAAKIAELAAIARAAPVFNPPLGFQARPLAHYAPSVCERRRKCAEGPLAAELDLAFYYFSGLDREGNPAWGGPRRSRAVFYINNRAQTIPGECFEAGSALRMPDRRKICLEPIECRRVAGYPVYYRKEVETLVFTNGRPVWVPMTAEEYLEAIVRDRETGAAEELRAELAALTAEQRALPAWYLPPRGPGSGLVPPGTPEARAVVTENPAYFDPSLPRTALQLLAVDLVYYAPPLEPPGSELLANRRLWEFSNTVDWKRVAALVEPASH
jgi:hypothetical protein